MAIILIISTLINLQAQITIFLVLKIIYFGVLGGIIMGGVQTIFSVTGLWTYKSNEVVWSVFQLHKLAEYPLEIYNNFVRFLITCIFPFAFASYYPTLNYLGQSNLVYIAPIVAIVIWVIAIKIWNWGLNQYRSTGN